MNKKCFKLSAEVNKLLGRSCKAHKNSLTPCKGEGAACNCSNKGTNKVDLIMLIDSSSTMASIVGIVNSAANAGLQAAKKKCRADIRTVWLWVDKEEPGSSNSHALGAGVGNFSDSHQVYLENLGITGPFYHDVIDNVTSYWQPYEKGAAAISDLSEYFDWRSGACRSILYVSDTKLAGHTSNATDNDIAVNQAINVANSNNVTIFAHRAKEDFGGTWNPPMTLAEIDADYTNLCSSTGGHAELGGTTSTALYTKLIEKAVCNCKRCIEISSPEIKPCITVSWGDSICDGVESSDCQTFCITVCNCYSNVTFENLIINRIKVTKSNGANVPVLPNGMPVINPIPMGPICFGDVLPCKKNKPTCVSRQFMIETCGAKPGNYQIHLEGICFNVNFHYDSERCFNLEIC